MKSKIILKFTNSIEIFNKFVMPALRYLIQFLEPFSSRTFEFNFLQQKKEEFSVQKSSQENFHKQFEGSNPNF